MCRSLRSRRFSCFLFAPSEVAVRSVVPEKDRPSYMPAHVDDAKRRWDPDSALGNEPTGGCLNIRCSSMPENG